MNKGFIGLSTLLAMLIIVVPLIVLIASYVIVQGNRQYIIDTPDEIAVTLTDEPRTAIVFGSGLRPEDGTPRPVLTARLDAALDLYDASAVDKLIVSGSAEDDYNEPRAMHDYLVRGGVPSDSIILDEAGDRTLATCINARNMYGVRQAVLVTQSSHIARAIHLCRSQDITAYGYAAKPAGSQAAQYFQQVRETGGNVRAVLDVLNNEREELAY